MFNPVYDDLVLFDANMQAEARTGLPEANIHKKASRFRTVYVYNYAQIPEPVVPFFAFSKTRNIMNVVPRHTPGNV